MNKTTDCRIKRYVKNCLALAFVLMLSLILSGCDDQQIKTNGEKPKTVTKTETTVKTGKQTTPAAQPEVTIYFPDKTGDKLLPAKRKIKGEAPAEEVISLILEGPDEGERAAGMVRPFPRGVKLLGVTVKNKVARVDFSKELTKNVPEGSTGEIMLAASLVNTLTKCLEIKKVQFLVEGKGIEILSGHLDFSEPMEEFKDY